MGRSVTVLTWADIQSLVKICSREVPSQDLDPVRHALVDSFSSYFRHWQPGEEMDDEFRRPLVHSLEGLADGIKVLKKSQEINEIVTECKRIAKLLRRAMGEDPGDDDEGSGGPDLPSIVTAILVYLSMQGQWLSSFFKVEITSSRLQVFL